MTSAATFSRPFVLGTTGWTASDLDDPSIEREWLRGRYEIVEGVLTQMPAAYYSGGETLIRLIYRIIAHAGEEAGGFAPEADIVIDEMRVVRADAVFLTPTDKFRQAQVRHSAGRTDPNRTRILIPPTLVIESLSPGHEVHDQKTKRRWYAEFGVPNYWLLNSFERSLQCLVLDGREYRQDVAGRDQQEIRPSLFPNLAISLEELWPE